MLTGLENPVHLLLVFIVLFALFGAKRLPEMGRSIGTGIRGFKDELTAKPDKGQRQLATDSPDST